jgi:AraC-like DNA-binding protein
MALSRTQLHRKLRALVNNSCSEFIRTIRLNQAAELLRKRTASVSEIAYGTGFNNPSYFSITFKQQFGMSPSEYQKN